MAGIFKKNDIRGKVADKLTPEFGEKLGYIFGDHVGKSKNIAIGGDTRKSTPVLVEALTKGLRKSGCNVYNLGTGPTPMMYFAAAHHDHIDEAIMVTGSHNPPDQNGIKICNSNGLSYHYDNLFRSLEEKMENFTTSLNGIEQTGRLIDAPELRENYYTYLIEDVSIENSLNILVDYGKGATFQFSEVLDNLGVQFDVLGDDPDGTFDGHPPDPAKPRTFDKIKDNITSDHLIAIAFDTDGDRVGFMTSDKEIISPDLVAMLLAESVKLHKDDPQVIIDVKVSKATAEYVQSIGGTTYLSQVGHSYIHEKLLSTHADVAAELSGHYYFHDRYYGFDDGLYTAIRFLEIIDKLVTEGKTLEEKLQELPRYFSTKEYRDPLSYDKIDKVLIDIEKMANANGAEISKIDGIRAEFDDGWFLLRKSGTEEILSYRVEGNNPDARDRILNDVKSVIAKY